MNKYTYPRWRKGNGEHGYAIRRKSDGAMLWHKRADKWTVSLAFDRDFAKVVTNRPLPAFCQFSVGKPQEG